MTDAADSNDYPLAGIRVLDLSRVLAGPFAGRVLADLGADVVKIEPPEGDVSRAWGKRIHGLGGYFTQQNGGKRNVCVDLSTPGGPAVVADLAAVADVVIENFRPGVMARFGLGWAQLQARNPRLVMLSISGFGQNGPESQRAAYAAVIHAESGLVARATQLDGIRMVDQIQSTADVNAGLHGLVALLAALMLRDRTGRGQHIDLAMLDAMVFSDDAATFSVDDIEVIRGGGRVWDVVGGPIMINGEITLNWKALAVANRLPEPGENATSREEKRQMRSDALDAYLLSFSDRSELIAALDRANLAWGDVRAPRAVMDSPTMIARRAVTEVDDRGGGVRPVLQSPYRFSDAPSGMRRGAAYRGEHNTEVLHEWLGAADERIRELAAEKVLLHQEERRD